MGIIEISAVTKALEGKLDDLKPITDPATLQRLHCLASSESCLDYIDIGEGDLDEVLIDGGVLRFDYNPELNLFRITTAYDVSRRLTEEEEQHLVAETLSQWNEGVGCNDFGNCHDSVLALPLAQAIMDEHGDEAEFGTVFVDLTDINEPSQVQVSYFDDETSDDAFVKDLKTQIANNNPVAMVGMGQRFLDSQGDEQHDAKAYKLFTQAADMNHPLGMVMVGRCLQVGVGCVANQSQAIEWFRKAVDKGEPEGFYSLGMCYANGEGLEKSAEEAVNLFRAGATMGNVDCLAELGRCLEEGVGTERDLELALTCYKVAYDAGLDEMDEAIARLQKN
ncbi:MAG: sel1 repeat family protein [Pirellulaceae bacterium]|jgi:hypothetical protein|nr:sel1 repeat family protein [Pirellulaceae bacterium]